MLDGLIGAGLLGEFLRVMAEKREERELWQMYLVAPRDVTFPEFLEAARPEAPPAPPDKDGLIAQTLAIAGVGVPEGGEHP